MTDWLTTAIAIKLNEGFEGNVVMNWVMLNYSMLGVLAVKLIVVIIIIALLNKLQKKNKSAAYIAKTLLILMYVAIVANNIYCLFI